MIVNAKKLLNDINGREGLVRIRNRYGAILVPVLAVIELLKYADTVDISIRRKLVEFRYEDAAVGLYGQQGKSIWTVSLNRKRYHA